MSKSNLRLREITVLFGRESVLIQQDLSLDIGVTVITGPNGSGKSTLLRVAAGELAPTSGAVFFGSSQIEEAARRVQFSYLPQDPQLPGKLRVDAFLQYALWLRGKTPEDIGARVDELIQSVHLERKRRDRIATLSAGMRQRVALAAYLCDPGPVILLDEPTTGLDQESQESIHAGLTCLGSHAIVLIASHDPKDVDGMAGCVIEMRNGTVLPRPEGNLPT